MQSAVVLLILASALLHAVWNAALKRERDPEAAAVAILVVAAALALAATPFARGRAFPGAAGLAWTLAAGVCEGGYFVTLALGMRDAPLGVVYTVARGGAIVAVWPVSAAFLDERVTALSIAGALVVVVGLALVGIDRAGRVPLRGVAWAAICALFIAGYHVFYKCALGDGAEPTAVFAVALGVALPINVGRLGRPGPARVAGTFRAGPLTLLSAGALCAASFLMFLSALARGGAGAVLALRNTSVVFALLLAWAIGERPVRRQVTGILAVALGAVLLGWPR